MKKTKSLKDKFDISEKTEENLPKKFDMSKRLNRYDACFRLSAAAPLSNLAFSVSISGRTLGTIS